MARPPHPAQAEAGLSLLEVMVALALFAVIAAAGFTLLDGVLRVGDRTDGRLERLAEVGRAVSVLTADIEQAGPRPVLVAGATVAFRRAAPGGAPGEIGVRYEVADGQWRRTLGDGAAERAQVLLTGVQDVRWTAFTAATGWTPLAALAASDAPPRPEAVAVEVVLVTPDGGLSGTLRRVVRVPAAPGPTL